MHVFIENTSLFLKRPISMHLRIFSRFVEKLGLKMPRKADLTVFIYINPKTQIGS
jgi:hypothetical protein